MIFSFPIPFPRLLVPLSKENADQLNWVLEWQKCSTIHGRAVGAVAECSIQREWDSRDIHPTEERGD